MLTKNYNIMTTYGEGETVFKYTTGTTVNKGKIMSYPISANRASTSIKPSSACGKPLNYPLTTATNSYTEEKTAYTWRGVIWATTFPTPPSNVYYDNYLANYLTLFVGTGTTAPTTDDYCLDSAIELAVASASCEVNTTGTSIVTTRTFSNNTGSDVTITEVGLYLVREVKDLTDTTEAARAYPLMIARQVLSTPVVIPAGISETFNYKLDISNLMVT